MDVATGCNSMKSLPQPSWCFLLLAVLLGLVHSIDLNKIEITSRFHPAIVRMACNGGGEASRSFYVKVPGENPRIVMLESGNQVQKDITFEITPNREGEYYCEVGGERSNSVFVVAFPESDPVASRNYTAQLRDTVTMNCTIPIGVLRDRYTVRWFKGLTEITGEEFQHIRTNNNSALIFSGVKVSDSSKAYFCTVSVERNNQSVSRQGSTIALNVLAPLRMTRTLSSVSANIDDEAEFMCEANGVPAPEFRWLLNGSEHTNGVTTTSEIRVSTVEVRSTLVLPSVMERHTGTVTCVAFHDRHGETALVTSSANLVVLTSNFEVDLIYQDGQVLIGGTLPAFIVGFFSLQVRFHSVESVPREENAIISDPSLADTNKINIKIPKDKLPSFRTFSVAVAIRSSGENGPFTENTEPLDLPDSFVSSCDCTSIAGGGSSNVVVIVISILVVMVAIGVLLLIIGGLFVYYKKSALAKDRSECSHSFHGSLRRSVSYSSQGSRHSSKSSRSRSRTCGSESDCCSHRGDGKVAKDERDVRDYETIDHKMLKQWEEKKAKFPAGKDIELPVEGVHEYPRTHIGIPSVPQKAFKDSQSSFEDLEDECQEFTEIPRSC